MRDRPLGEHRDDSRPELSHLSPREREVFDVAIEGLSARAIAGRLSLTEATVRSHLSAIYSKLGVAGRAELLARMNGVKSSTGMAEHEPKTGQPGSAVQTGSRKSGRWLALVVALLSLGVMVAAVFLVTRPDLPRRTDLTTVSQLLGADQVAQLDLSGATLTVIEKSGERLRVESVTLDSFQPLQTAALTASVPLTVASASSTPPAVQVVIMVSAFLPLILLVAAVVVLIRMVRRPPRVRPRHNRLPGQ